MFEFSFLAALNLEDYSEVINIENGYTALVDFWQHSSMDLYRFRQTMKVDFDSIDTEENASAMTYYRISVGTASSGKPPSPDLEVWAQLFGGFRKLAARGGGPSQRLLLGPAWAKLVRGGVLSELTGNAALKLVVALKVSHVRGAEDVDAVVLELTAATCQVCGEDNCKPSASAASGCALVTWLHTCGNRTPAVPRLPERYGAPVQEPAAEELGREQALYDAVAALSARTHAQSEAIHVQLDEMLGLLSPKGSRKSSMAHDYISDDTCRLALRSITRVQLRALRVRTAEKSQVIHAKLLEFLASSAEQDAACFQAYVARGAVAQPGARPPMTVAEAHFLLAREKNLHYHMRVLELEAAEFQKLHAQMDSLMSQDDRKSQVVVEVHLPAMPPAHTSRSPSCARLSHAPCRRRG